MSQSPLPFQRSLSGNPGRRAIADELTVRQVKLSLGASVYYPNDAVGRLLFNVLAMVAESNRI